LALKALKNSKTGGFTIRGCFSIGSIQHQLNQGERERGQHHTLVFRKRTIGAGEISHQQFALQQQIML
jgi:hypothetical protein